VKLTVLGRYSPYPPGGGAGPGYWVECDDQGGGPGSSTGVLLDCGPGVLARFQEHVGPLAKIHTVVLSHLHFDHMSDVTVLRYAAASHSRYRELPHHVRIYAPSQPESEFSLLTYKEATLGNPLSSGMSLEVGPLRLTFHQGIHGIPSFAVRVEGPGGVLAYSGDTRPCDALVEAAKGADLFLCEASGVQADADYVAPGHLTSRQAGEIAAMAGVKRLLLTHLWPLYDEDELLRECRDVFPHAELAEEGRSYSL
jgi:ribonuclease BN (tRNA processing enzyme)